MLTIPKQPIMLQLAIKGFAVFSIGFVGSMAVLNYFHSNKPETSPTSSVVAPGAMSISAKPSTTATGSTDANNNGNGSATSGASAGSSAQWSASFANPTWSSSPYIAPTPQVTQPAAAAPAPAAVATPTAPQPVVSPSTTTTTTTASPAPAPAPAPTLSAPGTGSVSVPLPAANLQGSTTVTVPPISTNALPLN